MEPLIHSHITDVLPDDHPLAHETIFCGGCTEMLHASNNECMQTWVESGAGAHCLRCFTLSIGGPVLEDGLALSVVNK